VRAIAPRDVCDLALLFDATLSPAPCDHAVTTDFEADELRSALDLHAGAAKVLDQKPLVLVLRKDEQEGKGAQPFADVGKGDAPRVLSARPQIYRRKPEPAVDDLTREAYLSVELERAGVDRQGPRRRSRLRGFVDDSDAHTEALEPERQNQPGRARADDEDLVRVCGGRRHAHPS
jgi:hypothetical protein